MAQRYGRRRRRAHQELIAAQQSRIDSLQRTIYAAERAHRDLQHFKALMSDWDADVRSMLGPYSALLFKEGTASTGKYPPTDLQRLPLPERLKAADFVVSECIPHQLEMHVASLKHCIFSVFDDVASFNQLRTYMRLLVTGAGEQIIAFTDDYWRQFGRDSRRDVHWLAETVAKRMLAKIGIEPEKRAGVRSEDATRRK